MQDQKLILRLKDKDPAAFTKIYDMYAPAIYGVILKICSSERMAEEVLQDTFMAVWDKSNTYDEQKAAFYTWLYRIARNKALNALRNLNNKVIQTEDIGVYTPEAPNETNDNHVEVKGSLNHLKPHHKKAIELIYFNGYTHREAHEEMEVPLGTFKSYVKQALKQLKENYDKVSLILLTLIQIGK